MEEGQCCVYLSRAVYTTWCSLAQLENLTADTDIAQFLVAFYVQQKQRTGWVRDICAACHSPLSLFCTTCQCPSPLSLSSTHPTHQSIAPPPPTHHPHQSIAPPPPTHASDTSAPHRNSVSVADDETDHNPQLPQKKYKCPTSVKDDFTCSRILNDLENGDHDFEDCSSGVDIVKTESVVDGCNLGSDLNKPVTDFQLASSNVVENRKLPKRSKRAKCRAVSDQSQKKKHSACSASWNKVAKTKLTGNNEAATSNSFLSCINSEGVKTVTEHVSSHYNCVMSRNSDTHKSSLKEHCSKGSLDDQQKARKKRKPCASGDLEEGRIISAEERGMAAVHVYDDSYFERHERQNERLKFAGRRKNTRKSKRSGTRNSGRGTLSEGHTSSFANSDGSRSDEEPTDHSECVDFMDQCPPSHRQEHENKTQICDSEIVHTRNTRRSAHEVTAFKMHSSSAAKDTTSSGSPPLSILVSAQKILPLRTTNGSYAQFLYSYFECAHCRKAFIHKRAFNGHIQTHLEQNSDSCKPASETDHARNTNSGAKYKPRTTVQCEICGTHLKSMYALRFHIAAIHKNERPFSCGVCGKSFVLKTKLRSHMKYKHAEGGPQFHCDQCSYRAFDARGLKVHQTCVHSKERPFHCSFCPSAFALKFYLDVHLRRHTGEKPFRCDECSQTFAQRSSLTRHWRKHHHGLYPPSAAVS